ncbi:MAG: hypothetical protein AAFY48_06970 [Bacteroidota bacterium]
MKRTVFPTAILLVFLLFSCEPVDTDVSPQPVNVMELISALTDLDDVAVFLAEHQDLTADQLEALSVKYYELGGRVAHENDLGRYPLCTTRGVFYPNGNDTPPCLVRHKMTFLQNQYDRYEDEIYIFQGFEFDASPACVETLSYPTNLYTFECLLSAGSQQMEIYMKYISYDPVTGQFRWVNRLICGTTYSCG